MGGVEFLETDRKGWARSWGEVRRIFGDCSCTSPNGECWQYMGSTVEAHEFRHRDLPVGAERHARRVADGPIDPRMFQRYPDGHGTRGHWRVAVLAGDYDEDKSDPAPWESDR